MVTQIEHQNIKHANQELFKDFRIILLNRTKSKFKKLSFIIIKTFNRVDLLHIEIIKSIDENYIS